MINNDLCESCGHAHLCKYRDFIEKFSDEVKRPMGIDITMDKCSSYEKDE